MDARKIQFLIGMQREIDKLEAKEGNTPKIEKVKSRFYDVLEVEEIVGNEYQAKQNINKESHMSTPEVEGDVTIIETKFQWQKYTPEEVKENQDRIAQLLKERGQLKSAKVDTSTGELGIITDPPKIVKEGLAQQIGRKSRVNTEVILDSNVSEAKPVVSFPHKPKDVVNFMKLFDDASSLKYLTHDFDEVDQKFNIRNFLNEAKKIFNQYTYKFTIPASLWKIINQFAFQENPKWFAVGREIDEGWSSERWIQWSEINGYPSKNLHFEKIIKEFKEQVRVRALSKTINGVIEKKFGDQRKRFNFNLIELEKADFYTHVDSFIAGLEHLFDEICNRPEFPNVTIQLERRLNEDYRHRIIHICHHDSFPSNKSLEEVFEKYQKSGGNLWEVRRKLFGYCDWYIETVWDEQPMRIHLLKEGMVTNKVDIEIETLDSIVRSGFTHTLTFYTR